MSQEQKIKVARTWILCEAYFHSLVLGQVGMEVKTIEVGWPNKENDCN